MKTINTINAEVIAKAAAEAGIRENENYEVQLVSFEKSLAEIIIETEWNRVTCYVDTESGEVLGLMGEAKSIEELLEAQYNSVRVHALSSPHRTIA